MDVTISFSIDENSKSRFVIDEGRRTKDREFKGTSTNKHVADYCVVDLETTGIFVSSAEIIEISAIKVRNNNVIDEFSTLINPHCHIPAEATAVNHITDEMVKDAPSLVDVIDAFLEFVEDDIIVGYNNASFDMNLLYDRIWEIKSIPFRNCYIDVLHASKRCLTGLDNYKLNSICIYYDLDTEGEHRALKDCYLTKSCYDKLFKEFGNAAFERRSHAAQGFGIRYSSETHALQELHGLLERILKDGEISVEEVNSLRFWIEEHRELSGNYPFDKAFGALDNILEDGKTTQKELDDLKIVFSEIIDPVKCYRSHESINSLQDKHVCLTGEFVFGAKAIVENLIIDAGGVIDKTVKKTTDYLAVGANGSDAWKTGNYGGKIQKAVEFNKKGANIKIVEEDAFIPQVQYLIANQ